MRSCSSTRPPEAEVAPAPMLTRLSIRDLVLIERADIERGPGLTVLTGETGAGKSILLDGLGLVLGARADAGLVRQGAREAQVTAEFQLEPDHPALALLAEQGLEAEEDGRLILRRLVKADGGSRAFVNDQPASAGLVRSLGGCLVEIHGQHDDRGLLAPRGHRALLDAFGGLEAETQAVARAWEQCEAARAALAESEAALAGAQADRDWLQHAADEIAALDPRPGEEAALADARARMKTGERMAGSLDELDRLVSGSEGALSQLRQAARRLERLADADAELGEALAATDRALVEGDLIEAALGRARARFSVSPEQLEAAETRLFDLRALARKHRVEVDDLPRLRVDLAGRLAALETGAETVVARRRAVGAAEAGYATTAARLSAARAAAAARLDAAVNAELPALKLETARFRTAIAPAAAGPSGTDSIAFEVATNPDAGFGPLTRIASGGELSRFILALKVALARTGSAGTLIFDEIDRGVGGATASAIGARLARVAEAAQVLVVTHSPQVAAAGTAHLRIEKAVAGDGARTAIAALDMGARTEEVARMLSGAEVTGEARAQAARLLARAA
jgi:DNA repair protein RecN (Recombination protein N)